MTLKAPNTISRCRLNKKINENKPEHYILTFFSPRIKFRLSAFEWNPRVWPFKWKLSSSTLTWYYLFSMSVFFKPVQRPSIFLEIQSSARMKMKTAGDLLSASAPSDVLGTRKNSSKKQEETSVDSLMYLPSVRVKFYGVTIQMKPLQQCFHIVLFSLYVVLTFESGWNPIVWPVIWNLFIQGTIYLFL